MKKLFILIFITAIVSIGVYIWWRNGVAPADSKNNAKKAYIIRPGEGTREIVEGLKKTGLIRDPIVFFLMIKKMGIDGKMQAGVFYLSPSMSSYEIIQELLIGKFDLSITIPEGKRAEEIADIFKQTFSHFTQDWRAKLNSEEGYLFPDTYYFPKNAEIEQMIVIMKNNFNKKYKESTNNTSLTQDQIVILASLIEREAKTDADRALVSSVIHNRLGINMKLDIDATVQYALGFDQSEKKWWKKELTYDDLNIDSLYNTYKNPGLPPGPICNPGLSSIIAAASPANTDFLFYISDKEGNNHYASTLEDHNRNIAKYRD